MPPRTQGKPPALQSTTLRNPTPVVSTDLDIYDRSDPFAAMDALRKLLSSLSTKPGPRQYKMSPEEYTLSMHLLMIVGPFVGSTPCSGNVSRLPVELLDKITFFMDSKDRIMSFALTCQWIYTAVFSAHFNYRVVKAKVSSVKVWRHIIVNRRLARNIRRLEIVDERKGLEVVPPNIPDVDTENTGDTLDFRAELGGLLVSAIAGMQHLQEFKWTCTTSLVPIESLLPTLQKIPQLRLVDLNDNAIFSRLNRRDIEEEDGEILTRENTSLTEMTTITVKGGKRDTKNPQLIYITGLLTNCPNLQNLEITYTVLNGPIADEFYSSGSWKHLTFLTLNNLQCTDQGLRDLATFLSEHHNLETLHFGSKISDVSAFALYLSVDTLPRLKELKSNRKFANAILSCKTQASQPLEILKGVRLGGSNSDRDFLGNLARIGSEISRVELAGWREMDDLRKLLGCVPRLTWLDVGTPEYSPNKAVKAYNPDDWATLLQRIPDVTTFFGVKLFYPEREPAVTESDRSRVKKNKETASRLASKCKKLRRLEHWEDGGSKVIILSREEGDKKYHVKRMRPENTTFDSFIE